MTPDDELRAAAQDVQRLLGRCILRLQIYERLLKAILTHSEIGGEEGNPRTIQAERAERYSRKMLGQLVGEFLGSHLVRGQEEGSEDALPDLPGTGTAMRIRFGLGMSAEELVRLEADLGALVRLRNDLVHHFSERHDLWTVEGCRRAEAELSATLDLIGMHLAQLRDVSDRMEKLRQAAAEIVQSDAFRNPVLDGIAPDGTV